MTALRHVIAWATCYPLTMGAFALLTSCATLEDRANNAAIADGATTIGALALGGVEANPLGLAALPAKVLFLAYCKTLPEDEQAECHAVAGAVWGGAAVNNILVGVALLAKVACGPVCLVGGLAYGIYAWVDTAAERDFYAACAGYRRVSGETFRCVYQIASQ